MEKEAGKWGGRGTSKLAGCIDHSYKLDCIAMPAYPDEDLLFNYLMGIYYLLFEDHLVTEGPK